MLATRRGFFGAFAALVGGAVASKLPAPRQITVHRRAYFDGGAGHFRELVARSTDTRPAYVSSVSIDRNGVAHVTCSPNTALSIHWSTS